MSEGNKAPPVQWNVGKIVRSIVRSIAAPHDGTRVVSGSFDNCIRLWDARTGALLQGPFKGHASWV